MVKGIPLSLKVEQMINLGCYRQSSDKRNKLEGPSTSNTYMRLDHSPTHIDHGLPTHLMATHTNSCYIFTIAYILYIED